MHKDLQWSFINHGHIYVLKIHALKYKPVRKSMSSLRDFASEAYLVKVRWQTLCTYETNLIKFF
jgi:hypothetical protein